MTEVKVNAKFKECCYCKTDNITFYQRKNHYWIHCSCGETDTPVFSTVKELENYWNNLEGESSNFGGFYTIAGVRGE